MGNKREVYIHARMMRGLKQAGYEEDLSRRFTDRFIALIDVRASLPRHLFDIQRTIRILASREKMSLEKAVDFLIEHPQRVAYLFELPKKPKTFGRRLKYHPTREERIEAAIAVRNKYGSLPNSRNCENDDYEFLPENSITWGRILEVYYSKDGPNLSDEVADYERIKKKRADPVMPHDYAIYRLAMAYMSKKGEPPPAIKKRIFGLNSPYWIDVHQSLEKRGLTLAMLMENPPAKPKSVPLSEMPDNDEIAKWAILLRHRYGTLPFHKEILETLDGRKITAGHVCRRLNRERQTNLVDIVEDFERRNPSFTPRLSAREAFVKTARVILETGTIPHKLKNNIMIGEYSVSGISKHFSQSTVEGLDGFNLKAKAHSKSFSAFLVATGLAEKTKGGELIPAPREKIEKLIAAYTP